MAWIARLLRLRFPANVVVELLPGAIVAGRYRLERMLGQGGMGVVWAAAHTGTRKRVALKFLKGPLQLRDELRRRFMREARAASAVVHPNVLEIHDVFELEDHTPVMLMDLLEGETLGQRITRQGKLSVEEAADILMQVVSGVGAAHTVGVVHRDLKPDNVFLVRTPSGPPSVRVLDFGIAKLMGTEGPAAQTGIITGTGAMLGTPCYMSPEQSFGDKEIDHRTDIWSIGAMLYECLTGARPVEGDSIGQVVKRLITDGITPIAVLLPNLPPDIVTLVERMLSREREQRPGDLREVMEALSRHTAVRPPVFGAAAAETVATEEESQQIVVNDTDPSASTHYAPRSGPETAAAHTLSSANTEKRSFRTVWLVAGGAAIAIAALVARSQSGAPPSAPSARGQESASHVAAPAVPPTETAKAAPPAPVLPAAPAPSAESAEKATSKARASVVGTHRVAAPSVAKSAVAASAAPPASAPPAKPAAPPGGLAQKPPF